MKLVFQQDECAPDAETVFGYWQRTFGENWHERTKDSVTINNWDSGYLIVKAPNGDWYEYQPACDGDRLFLFEPGDKIEKVVLKELGYIKDELCLVTSRRGERHLTSKKEAFHFTDKTENREELFYVQHKCWFNFTSTWRGVSTDEALKIILESVGYSRVV